jgi:hypothetical protein
MVTGSGIENVPVLRLPYLSLLRKTVSDSEVVVYTLPQQAGLDGLIGLDFLDMYNLFVNRSRGILVIQERKAKGFLDRFRQAVELWRSMGQS